MTQQATVRARRPASWRIVLLAAVLTWSGVSGCAWVLVAIGSVLPEALFITPAQVSMGVKTIDFLLILVFALMFSCAISWIPLLVLAPVVKSLANKDYDRPLFGAMIGIVAGIVTSAIAFGTDAPVFGSEMMTLGIAVGVIMGATNMAILRRLRG